MNKLYLSTIKTTEYVRDPINKRLESINHLFLHGISKSNIATSFLKNLKNKIYFSKLLLVKREINGSK